MWAYLEIAGLTILIKIASSAERQNRTIRRSYGADSLSDLSAPRALVASLFDHLDLGFSFSFFALRNRVSLDKPAGHFIRLVVLRYLE